MYVKKLNQLTIENYFMLYWLFFNKKTRGVYLNCDCNLSQNINWMWKYSPLQSNHNFQYAANKLYPLYIIDILLFSKATWTPLGTHNSPPPIPLYLFYFFEPLHVCFSFFSTRLLLFLLETNRTHSCTTTFNSAFKTVGCFSTIGLYKSFLIIRIREILLILNFWWFFYFLHFYGSFYVFYKILVFLCKK